LYAKLSTKATQNSACLGHLGQRNTDRFVSISSRAAQGGQGKFCFVLLSLALLRILHQWKHSFMKQSGGNHTSVWLMLLKSTEEELLHFYEFLMTRRKYKFENTIIS
jgi:hypothetical protein